MTIEKRLNGNSLDLIIIGMIDTITAPQFESTITESIDGITCLTLDFAGVEYISSAGLRVLLTAQSVMSTQGKMTIKNISDDIMELFDLTGFADVLTIE